MIDTAQAKLAVSTASEALSTQSFMDANARAAAIAQLAGQIVLGENISGALHKAAERVGSAIHSARPSR